MPRFCESAVVSRHHWAKRGGVLVTGAAVMAFAIGAFLSAGSVADGSTSKVPTGVGKGHVTLTITADSSDQTWYNADAKLFEKAYKNVDSEHHVSSLRVTGT